MTIPEIIEIIISEYNDRDISTDFIKQTAENLNKKFKSDGEILERLRKICEQMI